MRRYVVGARQVLRDLHQVLDLEAGGGQRVADVLPRERGLLLEVLRDRPVVPQAGSPREREPARAGSRLDRVAVRTDVRRDSDVVGGVSGHERGGMFWLRCKTFVGS